MKKLLIGMLITCALGVVSCGNTNTGDSSANNNSNSGVTDGTNSTSDNNMEIAIEDGMEDAKTSIENLYNELKSKVEAGIDEVNADEWDKYKTEFEGEITNIRNTVEDASLRSTVDDIENLFSEYDTAIREKIDVAEDKVEEIKDRIENSFK